MGKQLIKQVLEKLEDHNNSERFQEIEQLHDNAFSWQKQDRIPLGIHVINPEYGRGLSYTREWLNPKVFFNLQVRYLADTLEVGSDILPLIGINHFGDAVMTSLFGAKQHMPDDTVSNLNDIGPTPLAVYFDIKELENIEDISFDGGLMPEVERFAKFYRENLPAWINLIGPMPSGPFSAAMELRGSNFLMDLIDRPQLCEKLISLCTNAVIGIEQRFRKISGTPLNKHYTNFGISGAGLRIGEDSMCNISKVMMLEFCAPVFNRINRIWGRQGHIHFCSLPDSRFEHIYEALCTMPEVAVASSQFGFEYYQQHLNKLRGKLAVESFYGDAYGYVCQKYGSFRNWANEFVPRFKNESGLVLYMNVTSIEEGKEVWDAWNQAHLRSSVAKTANLI